MKLAGKIVVGILAALGLVLVIGIVLLMNTETPADRPAATTGTTPAAVASTTTPPAPVTQPPPATTTTSTTTTQPVVITTIRRPTTTTIPPCSFSESIPRTLRGVVQVVTDEGTGTAFSIGDGWFATAAHVVVDAGEVTLHGERDVVAEVAAYDTSIDLAFIYTPSLPMPALRWADMSDLEPGIELAVVGFPTGVTGVASITDGRLSRLVEYPGRVTFLQTNAESNPGNSGGPVITECGKVAGVMTSKLIRVDIEGVSYAVGADTVLALLGDEETGQGVLWDSFSDVFGLCTPTETDWSRNVVSELDRIIEVDEDFTDAFNMAVSEQWALVEDDPTWQMAMIVLAFRYEQPALNIIDLIPAPTPGLRNSDYLLLEYASTVADFGQAMPRAIRLQDYAARDRATDDLEASYEMLKGWVEGVAEHCADS